MKLPYILGIAVLLLAVGIAALSLTRPQSSPAVPVTFPNPVATTTTSTSTPPAPAPKPEAGKGTLSGTMTIGPVCPVERIDHPCEPTPEMFAARKVAVYAADRKTLIATLTPDANGAFSAALPAGTYYVAMADPRSAVGGATGVPATITIGSGAVTSLAIDVDTGIR